KVHSDERFPRVVHGTRHRVRRCAAHSPAGRILVEHRLPRVVIVHLEVDEHDRYRDLLSAGRTVRPSTRPIIMYSRRRIKMTRGGNDVRLGEHPSRPTGRAPSPQTATRGPEAGSGLTAMARAGTGDAVLGSVIPRIQAEQRRLDIALTSLPPDCLLLIDVYPARDAG